MTLSATALPMRCDETRVMTGQAFDNVTIKHHGKNCIYRKEIAKKEKKKFISK